MLGLLGSSLFHSKKKVNVLARPLSCLFVYAGSNVEHFSFGGY